MKPKGSCHCRAVRFTLESETPYPYLWCCCSICRKTAGGGYAVNVMGRADSLRLTGETKAYRASKGGGERHFCPMCASALWGRGRRFRQYPKEAIIDWHRRRGLLVP
jgi:hypothetical protein